MTNPRRFFYIQQFVSGGTTYKKGMYKNISIWSEVWRKLSVHLGNMEREMYVRERISDNDEKDYGLGEWRSDGKFSVWRWGKIPGVVELFVGIFYSVPFNSNFWIHTTVGIFTGPGGETVWLLESSILSRCFKSDEDGLINLTKKFDSGWKPCKRSNLS